MEYLTKGIKMETKMAMAIMETSMEMLMVYII